MAEEPAKTHAITNRDYPALCQKTDKGAARAQRSFLTLQKCYLASLVAGSTAGAIAPLVIHKTWLCWFLAAESILLVGGIILLLILRATQYDKGWFDCRAVTESCRTVSWRYMMKTPPFDGDMTADKTLIDALKEIRLARPALQRHIAGVSADNDDEITGGMKVARALPVQDRLALYRDSRLRVERDWYAARAKTHAAASLKWFWSILGFQIVAITVSIVKTAAGGLPVNPVPVIVACAAAILAWTQTKRHDELAQSYSMAAQELGELAALAPDAGHEGMIVQFVEQVEEAISREHTMWCARRDILLRRADSYRQDTGHGG